MKSDVKLQINSLEALERLLGKDPEFEMEIRRSVGDIFLKNLLSHGTIPLAASNEITNMFVESVKSGYSTQYVLTGKARDLVANEIGYRANETIRTMVDEKFKEVSADLTKLINEKALWVANTLVDKVLDERFNAQVELEIKKRLGIK